MIVPGGPSRLPKALSDVVDLTVAVFESFEGAKVTREEWDQFVSDVGGELYVTYDWLRIWWRHYGENRQLRLFVFREGSRLVGLAPMFIERVRLGPLGLKIAKRVGADFALTIFSLPIAVGRIETVYRELIRSLIEGELCDAVWIGFLPGNAPALNGLRDACRSLQELVTIARDAPAGVHTVFSLPDSFETYIAGLGKQRRADYRRQLKLLNKSFKVESDVIRDPSQAHEAFANFKSLHERQWKAEGKLGHFGDWPNSESFNTDLVEELSQVGRFRMTRLFADGVLISMQFAFVFGGQCFWRLPARAPETDWGSFSLGILGLMQLIEAMINEGIHRIEAGVGHYDYKLKAGGEELQSRSVLVASIRSGVSLRVWLFLRLSDLLHLVYYRIWYLRLAIHLPLSIRPLWGTWIRCRL